MPWVESPYAGLMMEDDGPGVTIGSQGSPVVAAPIQAPVTVANSVPAGAQMIPPQVRYDGFNAFVNGGLPPAVQASGAHYSAPGAREAYERYGFDPVLYQRSPYATATMQVGYNPYGQMEVTPLMGFPSAYPHVVRGYSLSPMQRLMPWLQSMMPAWWNERPGGQLLPPIMPRRTGGGGSAGGGNPGSASAKNTVTTASTPAGPPKMVPPEIRYGGYNTAFTPAPVVVDPIATAGATNNRSRPQYQEVEIPEFDDMNVYLDMPLDIREATPDLRETTPAPTSTEPSIRLETGEEDLPPVIDTSAIRSPWETLVDMARGVQNFYTRTFDDMRKHYGLQPEYIPTAVQYPTEPMLAPSSLQLPPRVPVIAETPNFRLPSPMLAR